MFFSVLQNEKDLTRRHEAHGHIEHDIKAWCICTSLVFSLFNIWNWTRKKNYDSQSIFNRGGTNDVIQTASLVLNFPILKVMCCMSLEYTSLKIVISTHTFKNSIISKVYIATLDLMEMLLHCIAGDLNSSILSHLNSNAAKSKLLLEFVNMCGFCMLGRDFETTKGLFYCSQKNNAWLYFV